MKPIVKKNWATLFGCFAMFWFGIISPGDVLAGDIAHLDALAKKVDKLGRVPVIVRLNVDTQPDSILRGASRSLQRQAISNAQSSILRKLSTGADNNVKRFKYVPYMAMAVNRSELDSLALNPMVADIVEDRVVPPILAQSTAVIGAGTVWDVSADGSGWAVAVLDTGVDKYHNFLNGKVVSEACFSTKYVPLGSVSVCPPGQNTAPGSGVNCDSGTDGCDHGTHVAGIIAGADYTPGGPGYSGVARGADIIAIQVFSEFSGSICTDLGYSSPCALSYTSDQMSGLEHVYGLSASFDIASINMSLGSGQYFSYCDSDPTKPIIDDLRVAGIATVIASGNSSYKNAMGAPACISSAVSVGATCDVSTAGWPNCSGVDDIPVYSNIAPFISLLAPGSVIRSSVPNNGYASWHGTSMATPHVAGAWAMIKQLSPGASVDEVLTGLQTTGVLVNDDRSGGSVTGMSRINLDSDGDGIVQMFDNCPSVANTDQSDIDADEIGDLCDPDSDGDSIPDASDNCPAIPNLDQSDLDGDAVGDACDDDIDGDGLTNSEESVLGTYIADEDSDDDGLNDGEEVNQYLTLPLDPDSDDDGLTDGEEVLTYATDPLTSNRGDIAPRGAPDGGLNAGDQVVLSRIVLNKISPTTLESILADINQDDELNVVDLMLLMQHIIAGTTP